MFYLQFDTQKLYRLAFSEHPIQTSVAFCDTSQDTLIQGLQNLVLGWNQDRTVQVGNNLFFPFKLTLDFQNFGILPKYR